MKKQYLIKGMHCASCALNIENQSKKLGGIISSHVNFASNTLSIETKKNFNEQKLFRRVSQLGYEISIPKNNQKLEEDAYINQLKTKAFLSLGLSLPLIILMVLMFLNIQIFSNETTQKIIEGLLAFFITYILGWEIHKGAISAIRSGYTNMDTLISLGTNASFFFGIASFFYPIPAFFEGAALITAFHNLGRFIEASAKGRTSQAIRELLKMEAKTAIIIVNGKEKKILINKVKVGDIMMVRPGEKIPTDGIVIYGRSAVDESMATGESMPISKNINNTVIGATINIDGVLHIKATKVGADTFLSHVIKLVKQASGSRVPIQAFADKVTSIFVPVILIIAFLTLLGWGVVGGDWFKGLLSMISVLVIACPCALGLAIPTALTVGIGMGTKKGILIRQGEAIEIMGKVRMMIFDKTGTITKGKPTVTDIVVIDKARHRIFSTATPQGGPWRFSQKQMSSLLSLAASIEKNSEHPLGKAIVKKAEDVGLQFIEVSGFKSIVGQGVEGIVNGKKVYVGKFVPSHPKGVQAQNLEKQGKTVVYVYFNNKLVGLIAIADVIKDEAYEAIADLHKMGLKTIMLTGDNENTALSIARQSGINEVRANLLPEDKLKIIKQLQSENQLVAMVGDGINDAPALMASDCGIAIGTGTDIAIESGKITLVSGNLNTLVQAVRLSRETFKIIKQNLFWALFYNVMAIPVAALGFLATPSGPVIAAAAMAFSSVSVVSNSLRLRNIKSLN